MYFTDKNPEAHQALYSQLTEQYDADDGAFSAACYLVSLPAVYGSVPEGKQGAIRSAGIGGRLIRCLTGEENPLPSGVSRRDLSSSSGSARSCSPDAACISNWRKL
ncbi:hypothetical protein N6H14_29270 [Paenibacillus sp. CC-CFT747]|nr:hypothetical protein N6H14_29270 [Paenibacillus sp. CC-CFT747]